MQIDKIAILYSLEMTKYDFGEGHPFRGDRYVNFINLLNQKISGDYFDIVEPRYASDDELRLVHDADYIKLVEKLASCSGYLSPDTPLSFGMDNSARLIAGSSLIAGEIVAGGKYKLAVGLGGGMHHASFSRGGGFCIFNDVAICAKNLINHGLDRILILDTDAHAGDGTLEIFYEEQNILFISIHQDPLTLYPGTGFIHEIGAGRGEGYKVNVPLPPCSSDLSYEYVFDELIYPLAKEFRPQIIIRNGGSDPHVHDELTNLGLTLEGLRMIGKKVRNIANVCGGKVVDLPGSGYNPTLLPHGWLAIICGVADIEIELKEPIGLPSWLRKDEGLDKVVRAVAELKKKLRKYWKCFY
jgi:acetoin utilization protein AcuC